jgi:hypothetical protein
MAASGRWLSISRQLTKKTSGTINVEQSFHKITSNKAE